MESVLKEFDQYTMLGKPMHLIDPELMNDDMYTCITIFDHNGWSYDALKTFPNTRLFIISEFGASLRRAFFATIRGPKFMAPHKNNDHTAIFLRYHLGVVVHDECDGVLIAGNKTYRWRRGEHFVFDTTQTHSVYKSSDYQRTVLIVDFEP